MHLYSRICTYVHPLYMYVHHMYTSKHPIYTLYTPLHDRYGHIIAKTAAIRLELQKWILEEKESENPGRWLDDPMKRLLREHRKVIAPDYKVRSINGKTLDSRHQES